MKKYALAVLAVLTISTAMIFTGCGSQETGTAESSPKAEEITEGPEKTEGSENTKAPEKPDGSENTDGSENIENTDKTGGTLNTGDAEEQTGDTASTDSSEADASESSMTVSEKPGPSSAAEAGAEPSKETSDESGKNGASTPADDAADTSSDGDAAPTPGVPGEDSPFVGNWQFYSLETGDPESSVTHEQVKDAKEQGFDYARTQLLALRPDGTLIINIMEDISEGSWTDNGDGTGTMTINGTNYTLEMDGDLLASRASDSVTRYERSI